MIWLYLVFGIILAIVGCALTYYFGKSCVRYDEVEINAPMVIFIAFSFMVAGGLVNKFMELR
jgi:hypothetical protein